MRNKILLFIILFIIVAFACVFAFLETNKHNQKVSADKILVEKTKIAVCPTYYEIAEKLDDEKYEIIKTSSTSESVYLLANGNVGMILSGRKLKPGEPKVDSFILNKGYSFLGKELLTVYIDEIKNVIIYSDIKSEELKKELPDFKIKYVSDVYEYIEEGIVLTTWENTDYSQAEIVHVIDKDGKRMDISRQATLYCSNYCEQEVVILSSYFKTLNN